MADEKAIVEAHQEWWKDHKEEELEKIRLRNTGSAKKDNVIIKLEIGKDNDGEE